jgi:adenylosuccinate synthase
VAVNGTTALAVMLLDVLTGLDSLKIATGYRQNGKLMEFFPGEANQLVGVEAVYEELPGWSEDISTVRQQKDLPAATIAYLRRIQELLDCPIRVVSVGPEKSQTIPVEL